MFQIYKKSVNWSANQIDWLVSLCWELLVIYGLKFDTQFVEHTNFQKHTKSHTPKFFGHKAKVRISKRMLQENKARQIFQKTNISYPLTSTRTCAYQGVRNVLFPENLAYFVFLKHQFWNSPFCLMTDELTDLNQTQRRMENPVKHRIWSVVV